MTPFYKVLLLSLALSSAAMLMSFIGSCVRSDTASAGCWYTPTVKIMTNSKGEIICKSYDGEYVCYSNTVTGAELKEKAK